MSSLLRPDAYAGGCRVNAAGSFAFFEGCIRSLVRTGTGIYEITTDGTDGNENTIDVTGISSAVESYSLLVEIVSDTLFRVRTVVAGALADRDFYLSFTRYKTGT